MTTILRRAAERGQADHGWLHAQHTFSFGDYWDPQWRGFHGLLVINEDRVAAGAGFPTHGHRDMEIITWPLGGRLRHQDSLGNGAELRPGMAQVMSAGSGIRHSEMNPSASDALHLLQIWIEPSVHGAAPRYADRVIPEADRAGRWAIIAAAEGSPAQRSGALPIRADAQVAVIDLEPGAEATWPLAAGRAAWVHVASGEVRSEDHALSAGDALGVEADSAPTTLRLHATTPAQILLFDLAL